MGYTQVYNRVDLQVYYCILIRAHNDTKMLVRAELMSILLGHIMSTIWCTIKNITFYHTVHYCVCAQAHYCVYRQAHYCVCLSAHKHTTVFTHEYTTMCTYEYTWMCARVHC